MSASISSSGTATVDELVEMAGKIYAKVKKASPSSFEECKQLFDDIHEEYKDFTSSFPLVVHHIVYLGQYNTKAFKKHLGRVQMIWESSDKYYESEAEYALDMYKLRTPHYKPQDAYEYKRAIFEDLVNSRKKLIENTEKSREELKKIDKERDIARRQRIFDQLNQMRQQQCAEECVSSTQTTPPPCPDAKKTTPVAPN